MHLLSWILFSLMTLSSSADKSAVDWASQQVLLFKANHKGPVTNLTVGNGAPVDKKDISALNKNLINDEYLMESLQHANREMIPLRIVHNKGSGAFGYFKVTHNISKICKAKIFSEDGKKTKVAVRFSIGAPIIGTADTVRSAKGFAVKFYTEEGNFDITGFSSPMYPFKNPALFTSFLHSTKKNPVSNVMDLNTFWDFITSNPETLHSFMWVFENRGTPKSYRHMKGFSIHTFQVYNEKGESHFIKFHFLPDSGTNNLNSTEATRLAGEDPDYYGRDLYNAIASGQVPSWTVYIQTFTLEQATKNAAMTSELFDVTKTMSTKLYPLSEIGKLVLNENPTNYFADVEKAAFCTANLIPGVLGAPDKMYEARRFAYRDAQSYRLGVNFNKMHVNAPLHKAQTYYRDGNGPVGDNMEDYPTYYPNFFLGPEPVKEPNKPELLSIVEYAPNNTAQCKELYRSMTINEQCAMIENLSTSLGGASNILQMKALSLLSNIDDDLGNKVAQALRINRTSSDC